VPVADIVARLSQEYQVARNRLKLA
jgi:hypothetical protein